MRVSTDTKSTTVQCDNCVGDIDGESETHIQVVSPMEFKGETTKVKRYYCSLRCLVEKTRE